MTMRFSIAIVAAIASLAGICKADGADSAKPAMSTAEAIAAYEGTAEAARDPAEQEVAVPKDMKLILLVGQSNMSGRAPVTDEFKKPIDRCYKLNRDGKWALATNRRRAGGRIRAALSRRPSRRNDRARSVCGWRLRAFLVGSCGEGKTGRELPPRR